MPDFKEQLKANFQWYGGDSFLTRTMKKTITRKDEKSRAHRLGNCIVWAQCVSKTKYVQSSITF